MSPYYLIAADRIDFDEYKLHMFDKEMNELTPPITVHSNVDTISVTDGFGVNGAVPQKIRREGEDAVEFMYRPRGIYKNCQICVDVDGTCVKRMKKMVVTPGEMCSFKLDRSLLKDAKEGVAVRLEV